MAQLDNNKFDIVIVGGGAIGASLALALQKLPLSIAIIEARPPQERLEIDFDARSLSLSPASQRIFCGLGIWQQLATHTVPIEKIHVSDKGHFWANRFSAKDEGLEALGYIIEAQDLNRVLSKECQSGASIEVICPAKLVSLISEKEETVLKIEKNSTIQDIKCDLLVAADGSNSHVAQLQNIPRKKLDYKQTALVANIGLSRQHKNIAYERFTEHGPIAFLPLTNNRSALVWTMNPDKVEHYLQLSDQEFLSALQEIFGYRLGKFCKVGKRSAFPLKLDMAEKLIANSTVLLGNAAQTIHPVAGQGLNLGLRDVSVLASIIKEALESKRNIASAGVLQSYVERRKWDRRSIITLSDGLTRLYSNNYLPHSILRNLCMLGIGTLPPIKNALLNQTMGTAGRSSDLACGLGLELA